MPTPIEGVKSFLTSSLLSFTSTALVMPFEVGKTLAQCQWVPRDGIDPIVWGGTDGVIEEEVIEVCSDPLYSVLCSGRGGV